MQRPVKAMQAVNRKASQNADTRKVAAALNEILGEGESVALPDPGETWADLALSDLKSMPAVERGNWERLFHHAQTADGGKPSRVWSQAAVPLSKSLGDDF